MREAIGGTWLFQIAIVFILLFSGYLALSVNYSRAFKVKNEILQFIEVNEGVTSVAQDQINVYLKSVNHIVIGTCIQDKDEDSWAFGGERTSEFKGIYCVEKMCENIDPNASQTGIYKAHYKVTIFFKFDLPIIGDIFTFRVKGETKTIFNAPRNPSLDLACSEPGI